MALDGSRAFITRKFDTQVAMQMGFVSAHSAESQLATARELRFMHKLLDIAPRARWASVWARHRPYNKPPSLPPPFGAVIRGKTDWRARAPRVRAARATPARRSVLQRNGESRS